MKRDSTCIYYTANVIPNSFAERVREQILRAIGDMPLISVSHKPIDFGKNIVVNLRREHFNIYKQAYRGVMEAKTRYVAMAEDDIFYSVEHFDYIPVKDTFAYDRNIWGLYTWIKPPVFSYKGRRNLSMLICERDLFLKVMKERFAKYNEDNYPKHLFGEPGKYERQMGVKVNKWEFYHAKKSSIIFSHPTELSFGGLGKRKKIGENRTESLPEWGTAQKFINLYNGKQYEKIQIKCLNTRQ